MKNRIPYTVHIALALVLVAGMLGLQPVKSTFASTLTVTNTNNSGAGSLRQAITDASPGDIIVFDPALSGARISWSLQSSPTKNITIDATDLSMPVTLDGRGSTRLFQIAAGITIELKNIILTNGGGYNLGGAAYNEGTLKLTNSIVSNNTAPGFGGGVYNKGALIVIDSTFSNNSVAQGDSGAIDNNGTLIIENSTFINNSADIYCTINCSGAIMNFDEMVVTNSTFYDNYPGAIHSFGKLTIMNSTIAYNQGFGVTAAGNTSTGPNTSELHFINTIIAKNKGSWNSASQDCYNNGAMLLTNNSNLIESGNCGTPMISGDPMVGDFGDYGGSTWTFGLLPDSPAIDSGDDANCPFADQRGMLRPQGTHCDIGAYEYAGPIVPTPTNTPAFTLTPLATGSTIRASVSSNGLQANNASSDVSISGDGRYVAFTSHATNLVPGDTNGRTDIFIHDTQTGMTSRASVTSSGLQAMDASYDPAISADGQYVVFASYATNLYSGDTNGTVDVFRRDQWTGVTTCVSVNSNGVQGDSISNAPSISGDGRYIAFTSIAKNLVAADTNGMTDVFVRDMQSGQVTRVSVDSAGVQANGNSANPVISADGRYITFKSSATNLVLGDTNAVADIFVHDLQTGLTTRVSVDSNGIQADKASASSMITADGRHVVFSSDGTNLVPGDTNGTTDIFMHSMQSGMTSRISMGLNNAQTDKLSSAPFISTDGRYIAYSSWASNLVAGDTNSNYDIFVYEMETGKTSRVSVNSNGEQGISGGSYAPSLSADGKYVAFSSDARNLISDDTNVVSDIFVHRQEIIEGNQTPTITATSSSFPMTPSGTPTVTFTPTFTPTNTPTPTFTRTNVPTLTPSNTPTHTPTATPTSTPSYTPTASNTPTPSFTPTPSKAPISNCNLVTHGPETISGNTFSMAIDNSTGIDLQVLDLEIWWNHDGGGPSGSLRLNSIFLDTSSGKTIFFEGSVYSTSFLFIPDEPMIIPQGRSKLVFTFNKDYKNLDTSEQIIINLATNGCQANPIDSNSATIFQSIPLLQGWNLVSFNVHPTDTSVSSVLSSIAGNYDLVYAWDATGAHAASGNWLRADHLPESPDSLTSLNETLGFWIHMTAADTLDVTGTVPQSTNISLLDNAGGWNLVGYPSNTAGNLPNALSDQGVGTSFSILYAYHPEDAEDVWKIFDTSAPPFINDLTQLVPGFGYWVKVSGDHIWAVEYGSP